MAKSDLLKEAIADAKAVRETALANAKIALQEAFAPRIQSMLSAKLAEELEDEDAAADLEAGAADMEAGAEDLEAGAEDAMGDIPTSVNVGLDFNDDGDYDLTGLVGAAEEDNMPEEEMEMPAEDVVGEGYGDNEEIEENIDEIIEAILRETAVSDEEETSASHLEEENAELKEELEEAYSTVKQLKAVINEVNLLNAKLLYTNKLFRNFDLNEGQKMKVIENFDRAANTREAKLVFATLAESFNKPKVTPKRKMVKESIASKPTATTAPSKETTQILSEGFEMANRWKKLAGLI